MECWSWRWLPWCAVIQSNPIQSRQSIYYTHYTHHLLVHTTHCCIISHYIKCWYWVTYMFITNPSKSHYSHTKTYCMRAANTENTLRLWCLFWAVGMLVDEIPLQPIIISFLGYKYHQWWNRFHLMWFGTDCLISSLCCLILLIERELYDDVEYLYTMSMYVWA